MIFPPSESIHLQRQYKCVGLDSSLLNTYLWSERRQVTAMEINSNFCPFICSPLYLTRRVEREENWTKPPQAPYPFPSEACKGRYWDGHMAFARSSDLGLSIPGSQPVFSLRSKVHGRKPLSKCQTVAQREGWYHRTAHHLEKVVDTYSIDFFVLRLPSVTYLKLSFLPFKFHCSCDFFSHYSSLITQTQYHFSSMTTKTLHHKFLKDAGLSVNHSQLVSLYTMQQPEVFH